MILVSSKHRSSQGLLCGFIYGSLAVLLVCLFVGALIFSETYLKKERAREADSADLISHFFDSHYRGIREEMWTQSYEAIHLRVEEIAKQLGNARYDMTILDENGECVFRRSGPTVDDVSLCETPAIVKALIPSFNVGAQQHLLQFDYKSERYLYMVPIYAGSGLKGYLYASLSDPYEFHGENVIVFVVRIFGIPIVCILLVWLLWLSVSHRLILRPYLNRLVDLERKQAVAELAGMVAHNIQSPLVVVKSVARNIRGIDETQRRLLITASSRIEKIAHHLISHFTTQKANLDSDSFCFLWQVIDSCVAEKISILGARSEIDLKYQIEDDLYCSGIALPSEEVAAMLSNLMNNAVQSFEGQTSSSRKILLTAKSIDAGTLSVEVTDSGKGIPADILAKLKSDGGTYGKEKGAGLGLKHARDILGKIGGNLTIHSKVGQGATIALTIPKAPLPSWCPKVLDLSNLRAAVVLDDDPSVHLLWQQRLGSFPTTYLTNPGDFDIKHYPIENTFFILDYEIVGSTTTGLNLIVEHNLGSRALLATSYFNETEIQNEVEKAGAVMLPKFMINRIPIEFGDIGRNSSGDKYDLILIDDDPMIHELWQVSASEKGCRMKAVTELSLLDLDQLNRSVSIFIDKNLCNGVSGIDVAQVLYDQGFTNISLTTGEKIEKSDLPSFIRELRNKDFPHCN